MQCPRCQQANPPLAKFCLECGMPFKPLDESVQSGPLYAELQRALSESRAQQAATAEILDAISRSPTELQPILDAVAQNASRLCGAANVSLYRVEGNQMRKVAEQGRPLTALRVGETRPITRTTVSGRAIVDRTTIHLPDHQSAQAVQEYPDARRYTGIRTTIGIPLLREGVAVGVFTAYRTESRPFAEREITLLQTFANQAAIAIENVRLFNETKEALEQQTATTEILSVISSSPTDAQPVFEAIVRSAVRVCNARFANVFRLENDVVHLAAHHNVPFEALEHFRRTFPQPLSQGGTLTAQAMRHGTVVHIHDVDAQSDVSAPVRALTRSAGYRTVLAVPILRSGNVVGAIGVGRSDVTGAPWPFSDKEVALLRTFADQAVIAIENVRLFTELQEKNRALTQAHAQVTEALDRQTATSEILRVISSSPTDAQPVFEAIARNAARLCDASRSSVNLLEGDWIRFVAQYNLPEGWTQIHVSDAPNATRVIRDGVIFHVADAQTDVRVTPEALSRVRALGARSFLMVPLHRETMPIGSIVVYRSETGSFSDQQVELLQTFADQAVIAIENVRLFKELEGRNAELTQALDQQIATGEILRVISRSPTNVQPVFDTIVRNAVRLCGALHGGVYTFDGELVHARANEGYTPEQLEHWRSTFPRPVTSGSVVAKAIRSNSVVLIDDLETAPAFEVSRETLANLRVRGSRSLLTVPMTRHDEVIGAIGLAHGRVGAFSETHVELLKTFADQAVIAIENVRLFKELEVANRELQAASQHKSEFLANMSHELRTPLNAIIGFSEVLTDRMFGELNEKQEEYLKDIYASGTHLLSLINDILDLSKIEAGRMELELSDFDLPTALDNALMLVRERAQRRNLTLNKEVDAGVGQIQADERKIRQVVLNLLSNAIKFTPEGGRIELAAVPKDGLVEVSVSDTGVGIAPEDEEKVFEEFRQVGTADKKAEGTGLGLTLCRKFVELHGGRIWVKSEVGVGSTFTFSLPLRNS